MTSGATVLAWLKEENGVAFARLGLEPARTRDREGNQATGVDLLL